VELGWVGVLQGAGLAVLGVGLVLQFRSVTPAWAWRSVQVVGSLTVCVAIAIDLSRQQGFSVFNPFVLGGLAIGIALPLLLGWILSRFASH
jgi:hypothetical protein